MNSQRFSFDHFHPEQLREVINGSDLDHTILGSETCTARLTRKVTDNLSADAGFYSFPVLVRGQFATGKLLVGAAIGREQPTWVNGNEISRPSLQIYPEGTEMLYRAGINTNWMGVTISRETLQSAALRIRGMEMPLPLIGMRNYLIQPEMFAELFRLIRAEPSEFSEDQLVWTIINAVFSSDSSRQHNDEPHRFQIVSKADKVMRSLVGSKYSSSALCDIIGVSERSVQLYFREAFGMSPKSWFTKLSLNKARSRLLRSENCPGIISRVALDHGFDHLGRFSEKYRELFAELPSETLKLSRQSGF